MPRCVIRNGGSPRPAAPPGEELERAGIPSLLAAVLSARGIRTWEEARAPPLAPGETPLGGPHGPAGHGPGGPPRPPGPGDGETVAVYGDYDVDGITSTCLLTDRLSRMGGRILPYIPDRLEEGVWPQC